MLFSSWHLPVKGHKDRASFSGTVACLLLSADLSILSTLVQWSEYMDCHSGAAVLDPSNSVTQWCLRKDVTLKRMWEFHQS